MKAIELLKDYKNIDFGCNVEELHSEIDEAIAELEALENRSCNDCKYYLSDNGNFPLYPCVECIRFYADKFERKEDEN